MAKELGTGFKNTFKSQSTGNLVDNDQIPKTSPLGCPLKHWAEAGGDLLKHEMVGYCNHWWPLYTLDDEEKWPENGTLHSNGILQLMLFCKREGK